MLFIFAYIDNSERNDFNVIEDAMHFAECQKRKMTQTDISTKYSISQPMVAKKLSVLFLPNKILEEIIRQRINSEHAYEISRICKPPELYKLFKINKNFIPNLEEQYKMDYLLKL